MNIHDDIMAQEEGRLLLEQEYVGSMCEVVNVSNDSLALGRVSKIEKDALELKHSRGYDMPLLPYDMFVKFNIAGSKSLEDKVLAGHIRHSGGQILRAERMVVLQSSNRRNYYRMKVKVPSKLDYISGYASDIQLGEQIRATVEDISLGGVLISTGKLMGVGDRVLLKTTMLNEYMELHCLLIRMAQRDYKYFYGAAFFDLAQGQTDKINSIMMRLQQLNRKKQM